MKHWKVTFRRQAANARLPLGAAQQPTWRHRPNNPVHHASLCAFEALQGGKAAFAHARGLSRG